MPAGRPTDYTVELAEAIAERLADGEGLSEICRDDGFPSRNTVYRWRRTIPEFNDVYARGREDQGHTVADEARRIRQLVEAGTIDPAAARVMLDSVKWEAGKRAPRFYGDKIALVGGDDTDNPLRIISTAMTAKQAAEAYRDELG